MGCGASSKFRPQKDAGETHLPVATKLRSSDASRMSMENNSPLADVEIKCKRFDLSEEELGAPSDSQVTGSAHATSVEELRSELWECTENFEALLEHEKHVFEERYEEELKDQKCELEIRRISANTFAAQQAEIVRQQGVAEQARQELESALRTAEMQASSQREEAEVAERDVFRLRDGVSILRQEHEDASCALREAQECLKTEEAIFQTFVCESSAMEESLAESRGKHEHCERQHQDSERMLQAQVQELRAEHRSSLEELHMKDVSLRDRSRELSDVNGQLADLQCLFDDVNQQLRAECLRIGQLQDTIAVCAKQGQELDMLQGMLEESHRMLALVRDALEGERTERIRTTKLLEHEQQRTQLLLDVLKHFKEKLQGLTPQMLLRRLGFSEQKDLFWQGQNSPSFKVMQPRSPCDGLGGSFVALDGLREEKVASPPAGGESRGQLSTPHLLDNGRETKLRDDSVSEAALGPCSQACVSILNNTIAVSAATVPGRPPQEHADTVVGPDNAFVDGTMCPSSSGFASMPASALRAPTLRALSNAESQQVVFMQGVSLAGASGTATSTGAIEPARVDPVLQAQFDAAVTLTSPSCGTCRLPVGLPNSSMC